MPAARQADHLGCARGKATGAGALALALALVSAMARAQAPDVEALASAALADRKLPGLALVVMQRDDVVVAKGLGVTAAGGGTAVTTQTVFQLGSIGKTLLAALVVSLAERQRLSLDDPVRRHLPDFTNLREAISVRHLLSHTSGIREPFLMPAYQAGIEDLSRHAEEMNAILRGLPVDFAAGTRWSYSNANYTMLALVVERVTGAPYERALEDAVFAPHGLTSMRACTPVPSAPHEARGHVLRGGLVAPAAYENFAWIRGDGGLCGSAQDVARFFRLLATGRIVGADSYRAMIAPTRLADGSTVDYGLGVSLVTLDGRAKVAHNGAMLGFSASAAYYPVGERTVVVLTNRGNVRTESLERAIARSVLGIPAPDFSERPLSAEARERLVGRYDIGVFGVDVAMRDGRLAIAMPPPGPTSALRHLGDGEFACEVDLDACRVTFGAGDTRASTLRLYMGAMHWYGTRVPSR